MALKQTESKHVNVGGFDCYIKPFPAFKAANLTGELAAVLTPLLGALLPLVENVKKDGSEMDLMDVDVEKVAPSIAKSFEGISGDKIELLLRKLLIASKNIVVEISDDESTETEQEILNEELVNELFCGEMQDLFILAFEVIRLNFNGFFKKAGILFGKVGESTDKKMRQIF